jgi:hypothetical protein
MQQQAAYQAGQPWQGPAMGRAPEVYPPQPSGPAMQPVPATGYQPLSAAPVVQPQAAQLAWSQTGQPMQQQPVQQTAYPAGQSWQQQPVMRTPIMPAQ